MSSCYQRTVEDAYQKLLDNEELLSCIADDMYINGNGIDFVFDGEIYHLPKHSINCNSIYDVHQAVASKERFYRDRAATKKKADKERKAAMSEIVFDEPIVISLFGVFPRLRG